MMLQDVQQAEHPVLVLEAYGTSSSSSSSSLEGAGADLFEGGMVMKQHLLHLGKIKTRWSTPLLPLRPFGRNTRSAEEWEGPATPETYACRHPLRRPEWTYHYQNSNTPTLQGVLIMLTSSRP